MFSTKSLATAATILSLVGSSVAAFNAAEKSNVVMYWGQGPNQKDLAAFCYENTVDIIPIGFINTFPAQSNGWPGDDFGSACWNPADYPYYDAPGYGGKDNNTNNRLHSRCPAVQVGILECQKIGKKVLLSLGGGYEENKNNPTPKYALNGAADGEALAEFLWGAYGPYNKNWAGPRPLDGGLYNDKTDASLRIDIDGFDFDIELPSTDKQNGYIAAVKRLRFLMKRDNPGKNYIISAAPQCPFQDANLGLTINAVGFDMLFVQFYNNPSCAAGGKNGDNFDTWANFNNLGQSNATKIYLGLPGSSTSSGSASDYLNVNQLTALVKKHQNSAYLGGVMLWDATSADRNIVDAAKNQTYYKAVKSVLVSLIPPKTTSVSSTTTSRSSTTTSRSSTTTSRSSTTTSRSSTTTSQSSSEYPTSTQSPTSSSSTSQTVAPSSSSTSQTSSSTSQTSSSTSQISSSTSQTSSSSSQTSSSTSQISSSTSQTVTSTSSTVTPTGTCKPVALGCYTEAGQTTSHRTLDEASFPDFGSGGSTGQTVEKCEAACAGYTYFGLEYGGECYCGNEILAPGAYADDQSSCNIPCIGNTAQICGGGNRLNIYQYDTGCQSQTSTTTSVSSSTLSQTSTASSESSSTSATSSSTSSEYQTTSSESSTTTSQSSTSSSSSPTTSTEGPSTTDSSTTTSELSTTSESSTSSEYPTTTSGLTTSTSEVSTTSTSESSSQTTSSESSSASSSATQTESSSQTTSSESSSASSSATQTESSSQTTSSESSSTSSSATQTESSSGTLTSSSTTSISQTSSCTSSTQSPTSKPGGDVTSSSSSTTEYTTSTVYTTHVITRTSCAPTVTNCPAGVHLTTVTVPLYTTVCPVTKTPHATPTSVPAGGYTTSTLYVTKTYTVSHGQLTTATYATTVVYPPSSEYPAQPTSVPEGEEETTTYSRTNTKTNYITVSYVHPSTVTVVPTPKYPTGIKGPSPPVGSGTGVIVPIPSPYPTTVAGGEATSTPAPEFTGQASKMGMSGFGIGAVIALVALFL